MARQCRNPLASEGERKLSASTAFVAPPWPRKQHWSQSESGRIAKVMDDYDGSASQPAGELGESGNLLAFGVVASLASCSVWFGLV